MVPGHGEKIVTTEAQRARREDVHRRGAEARRETDRLKAFRR
jgi:hypothetical protein